MNLNSPRNLLKQYDAKPSKGLGQNFLVDKGALSKIVEAAKIKPTDTIVEIGPGTGVLTRALAEKAKKVIAIEKDRKMIEVLKETLKGYENVQIIEGDVLETDINLPKAYKVVANLPYYITSPIIRKFLEEKNSPELMILMVQKEVGQRICSKPPEMSILSVSVQFYGKPEIVSYVSKNSFWPSPKVDSAIVKITDIKKPKIDADSFFKIVKAGFSQPRKQIAGNFHKILKLDKERIKAWLEKNTVAPEQRAETLFVKDWVNLTNTF